MHVHDDGVLVRTLPTPVHPALRWRLHGVRLAGSDRPLPSSRYGCSGGSPTAVPPRSAGQRLQVGYAHRHTLVDIDVHEAEFHVCDQTGQPLAAIPRTSGKEVTRIKGDGVRDRIG